MRSNSTLLGTGTRHLQVLNFIITRFAGHYNFEGNRNLTKFLQLAQQNDLRIGPYTCGAWDNGGLPWWLFKTHPDIELRTSDKRYLGEVKRWFGKLLPNFVRPQLYRNGGPVLMIQIENEYGSTRICDKKYMRFLRDLTWSLLGNETILFTVDGDNLDMLSCGTIEGVYPTVDFGTQSKAAVETSFQLQRKFAPKVPLVNSEFYPGRIDHWGENWTLIAIQPIVDTMRFMHSRGASFNFYMIEGGTNFGFWNGAHQLPLVSSYDFDAPLSEAGDPTAKYFAIQAETFKLRNHSLPQPSPMASIKSSGAVRLQLLGSIIELLHFVSSKQIADQFPLDFEFLDFPFGFVLYETILTRNASNISFPNVRDRAYVMLDDSLIAFCRFMTKTKQNCL